MYSGIYISGLIPIPLFSSSSSLNSPSLEDTLSSDSESEPSDELSSSDFSSSSEDEDLLLRYFARLVCAFDWPLLFRSPT